jgi:hypothetical protein
VAWSAPLGSRWGPLETHAVTGESS